MEMSYILNPMPLGSTDQSCLMVFDSTKMLFICKIYVLLLTVVKMITANPVECDRRYSVSF